MNRILIDLPQVIETPRLKLHMPCSGFGAKLHEAMLDGYKENIKWLNWPSICPNAAAIEEDTRKHHAEFILRDNIRYIIIDKASDSVIGRCAFPAHQANWLIPQFGISYFIRQNMRSCGYASEAALAMTRLAFRILNAKKVEIYCDADNIASNKIPIKIGFKLEYTQKGGWPRADGELAQLQTYSIFSEDELPDLNIIW
jgi:ribosomal-protein-serine acetyltransferase